VRLQQKPYSAMSGLAATLLARADEAIGPNFFDALHESAYHLTDML